jgi:hypothetical protein
MYLLTATVTVYTVIWNFHSVDEMDSAHVLVQIKRLLQSVLRQLHSMLPLRFGCLKLS